MLRSEELQAQLLEAQRQESKDQRSFIQAQLDYNRRLILHYDEASQGETEAVERECGQRIERVQAYFGELKSGAELVIADLERRLRNLNGGSAPPAVRPNAGTENAGHG